MHHSRRSALQLGGALALAMTPALSADTKDKPRPRIKIGQIGVGHAHASKLSVYRKSPDYEVVGIVEPDAELRKRAEAQETYRSLTWMSQDKLLGTSGLQAVLVETRVEDLLKTAEACIAANLHVHIDKPAGASLPHFARILATAEKKKLLVQMGYMYRYNPGVVLLREFLKEGWLGDVFEIHTVMSKVIAEGERKKLARFSGGVMFELGCHVLDLVLALLGKPKEIASFNQHVGKQDDKLLDNMLAVLTYPKATASVKVSGHEVQGGERRHLVVCGTEGTFHIQPLDNPSARVTLSKARGQYRKGTQEVKFPKYTRYVEDAADMAAIVRGERASRFSYQHDVAVQETLLRMCGMSLKE